MVELYPFLIYLAVFVSFLWLVVAGEPLRSLLRRHPRMPSEAILSMLAQRGASSMVNRSTEGTTEAGAEETSRAVEPDLEIIGEGHTVAKEESGIVTREKSKKRLRKDGAPPRYHHSKKAKEVPATSGGGSSLKTAMDRSADVEHVIGKVIPDKKEFLKDFKGHLDHVCLFYFLASCSYFFLAVFGFTDLLLFCSFFVVASRF